MNYFNFKSHKFNNSTSKRLTSRISEFFVGQRLQTQVLFYIFFKHS